ncbi:MAG: transcriptional regulator, AraC family [Phenylobacterium sp.]|nr:transcriptional regulator, AraC family [Phenylobacterium sp.]
MLAQFGLSPQRVATEPGAMLSLSDYFRFWRAMKQISGEETLYLSARPLVTGTSDFVISDAARTATLLDGMERIAQQFQVGVAAREGLEPPTLALGKLCSILLSYRAAWRDGCHALGRAPSGAERHRAIAAVRLRP